VIRANKTEKFLIGQELNGATIKEASEIAKEEARPIDDIRSNAEYRREMVAVLLKRGLTKVADEISHA
jgi:carbon-monoxide dehydrogenase medium subunit